METRANYVIVGIFTVLSVLAAFGFVYWTARGGEGGDTVELRFIINGSAAGLSRGSAVLFNGVKVGDVQAVELDARSDSRAVARAQVDRNTPVTTASRARIGIAGLTGQANIEIAGGAGGRPPTGEGMPPENLFEKSAREGKPAEIATEPSAVTNLLESAQDIFQRTDSVLTGLEGFVRDVRGPLTNTVRNAEVFSEALKQNSAGVGDFLASVGKLSETLQSVSGKIGGTLDSARGLLDSVDRDKVARVVDNVQTFTDSLRAASGQVDRIVTSVDAAAKSARDFAAGANGTLARVNGMVDKVDAVVGAVDPATLKTALSDLAEASRTANRAVADVAKMADRIGSHTDDVDRIVANAREISERLNKASERVDGVLAKVDALLGSGDANGLMQQASDTLKSFRQVADTLNARMGTITEGLASFSGQGLRNVDDLVRESRRAVTRIEEAISNLSRNPQSIITGGSSDTVPRYDGRARR